MRNSKDEMHLFVLFSTAKFFFIAIIIITMLSKWPNETDCKFFLGL